MSNVKLIAGDLSKYSFISTVGDNANYPLSNLKSYYPDNRWISSSTAHAQRLIIDFGENKETNCLVIDNHNLYDSTNADVIVFAAADNSQFTSGYTAIATIEQADLATTSSAYYLTYNAVNKRYYRLHFDGDYYSAPYIGNIFIEKYISPKFSYNWDYFNDNQEYVSDEITTLDGRLLVNNVQKGKSKFEMKLQEEDNTFRDEFRSFFETIKGRNVPFYLIDGTDINYCTIDRDNTDITMNKYNQNDIGVLVLRSQKAKSKSLQYMLYDDALIV